MKRFQLWAALALAFGAFAPHLFGQAVPTAFRQSTFQLGGGFTFAGPDYSPQTIFGLSLWGDYNFTRNIGAEISLHQVNLGSKAPIGENSYVIGPRYVVHYKKIEPYAKALLGFGVFEYNYTQPHTHDAWFTYGIGGGIDYHVVPRINLRLADVEFQNWPNFPPTGLTPVVYTFGASYVFGSR